MEDIDNWWDDQEEVDEEETLSNENERERIIRKYEQRIKELEEENKQFKENQNEEEDPSPIQDMKTIIQDLLKEVKSQLGDLSEDEEDIYTDIRRGMRQDQDEETMRGYEEELRKILNKEEERRINSNHKIVEKDQDFQK